MTSAISVEAAIKHLTKFDLEAPESVTIRKNDVFSTTISRLIEGKICANDASALADQFVTHMFDRWHTAWLAFYQTEGSGLLLFWQTSVGISPLGAYGKTLLELVTKVKNEQFKCRRRLWCVLPLGHTQLCEGDGGLTQKHFVTTAYCPARTSFPARLMSKA